MRRLLAAAALLAGACLPHGGAQATEEQKAPPKTMMWLHGSAEALALTEKAMDDLAIYAAEAHVRRITHGDQTSVILEEGSGLADPRWRTCTANQPSAVIFDIDETLLLNTGWSYDDARWAPPKFSPERWIEWIKEGAKLVEPTPGAVETVKALQNSNIVVLFVSNRDRRDEKGKDLAPYTIAALDGVGIKGAIAGETMLLQGDDTSKSNKDPRRHALADRYCILAMAGDQMGDFSELFNKADDEPIPVQQRRALGSSTAMRTRLGNGWFLIPNPVYGPGVTGGFDDLFPGDKRWVKPAPPAKEKEPK